MIDPLKIHYLVVLETDELQDVTPFQLFSTSWRSQHWALDLLSTLPCDILEPSHKILDIITHRMGGMRSLMWHPINMMALQQISIEELSVFVAVLTGEEACANTAKEWINAQSHPVMHISTQKVEGACHIEEFSIERLHDYCKTAFAAWPEAYRPDQLDVGGAALQNWREIEPIPSGLKTHGHNITHPNYMSLRRAGRTIEPGERFISDNETEYTRVILESAEAVLHVREEVGVRPLHYMALLRPSIVLAEPALVRPTYARMKPEGPFEDKTVAKTMRWIQTQKGLHSSMDSGYAADLVRSAEAKSLVALRQSELETFMLGTGLFAAQTTSCVVRLSPGVNHVFPNLAAYANNVRSPKLEARLKSRRLFDRIQESLAEAVGAERIAFIENEGGPLKIVCDAPVEWLPVGNLPLGIRYDCSRLNATPGNLLMGLLTEPLTLTFTPKQLQRVLVVSAFRDDDPLRNILVGSLETIRHQWEGKAEVIYKTAKTQAEFVDALNGFEGNILIFDGHGEGNADTPIGTIMIADEAIDVWSLRGSIRMPPIVILSACDTHGIDASSQATVGNAFLGIGARTVLATLLPVGGYASAAFIARLVHRIADFIPAVLSAKKRVLNWTEVISGLLRMLLASEILDVLVGPPAPLGTPRARLQAAANIEINSRQYDDWYERLLTAIAEHRGEDFETVRSKARSAMARAEAIRYVQLGNPETILIDDGEIRKRVLQEYNAPVS